MPKLSPLPSLKLGFLSLFTDGEQRHREADRCHQVLFVGKKTPHLLLLVETSPALDDLRGFLPPPYTFAHVLSLWLFSLWVGPHCGSSVRGIWTLGIPASLIFPRTSHRTVCGWVEGAGLLGALRESGGDSFTRTAGRVSPQTEGKVANKGNTQGDAGTFASKRRHWRWVLAPRNL